MTILVIEKQPPAKSLVGLLHPTKLLIAALVAGLAASPARASEQAPTQISSSLPPTSSADPVADWWNGKNVSGNWFGGRDAVSDNGLKLDGRWRGIYFGILESQNGAGNAFSEEVAFGAQLDLAKALRWESVEGVSLFGEVRWRDPAYAANPNNWVEADRLFNPSRYTGGAGWRLMTAGLRYVAPEFLGVEDGLIVSGGWIQPQKEFLEQPLARLFANNAMASAEGLGGNIPFGSSFSTWGGTLVPMDIA